MTEHRSEDRLPAALRVDLWCRGELMGRFYTRNLSANGAFVEVGDLTLPSPVVELHFVDELGEHAGRVSSVVVRRSPEGIGLLCTSALSLRSSAGAVRAPSAPLGMSRCDRYRWGDLLPAEGHTGASEWRPMLGAQ